MSLFLFDFDGVIVDTFELCYRLTCDMSGEDVGRENYRDWYLGNIYDHLAERGDEPDGDSDTVGDDDPFAALYVDGLMSLRPVSGMVDLIRRVAALPGARLAIVSSTVDAAIDRYLLRHAVRDAFGAIYGASVHKRKDVKMRRALDDFAVRADDSVLITDTLGDIREAHRCGIGSIAVSWGYHDIGRLRQGRPLALVDTVDALSVAVSAFSSVPEHA